MVRFGLRVSNGDEYDFCGNAFHCIAAHHKGYILLRHLAKMLLDGVSIRLHSSQSCENKIINLLSREVHVQQPQMVATCMTSELRGSTQTTNPSYNEGSVARE